MLYLIGLGIWDEKDISLKGLEACKKADKIYAEFYTAKRGGSLQNLEKIIGKKIEILKRKDMEEDSEKILNESEKKNVVVLVPGDPLAATTHIHLISEAKKLGIPFQIIHSSSIFTAIGETGLSLYNFGRVVTLVKWNEKQKPTSFYEYIWKNKKTGLHSLILLDIDMDISEGLKLLLESEKNIKKALFKPETKVVAASKLGSSGQKIIYGSVEKLVSLNLEAPGVIILPGKLQFFEEEFLETLKI